MENKLSLEKLKKRVFSILMIMISCLFLCLVFVVMYIENKHIDYEQEKFHELVYSSYKHALDSEVNKYIFFAKRIEHIEEIKNYIKIRDRDALLSYMKPRWKMLKEENEYLRALHFHIPDGTSFLRLHNPEKFGDKLDEIRPMIKEIHKNKKVVTGYESGTNQLLFRIITPLFDKNKYIGAIEVGLSTDFLVKHIEEIVRLKGYVFIKANELRFNKDTQYLSKQGFYLLNKGENNLFKFLDSIDSKYLSEDNYRIDYKDKKYISHMINIKNNSGDIKVKLFFLQNVKSSELVKFKLLSIFTFFTLLVFIVLMILIGKQMKIFENGLVKLHKKQEDKLNNLNSVLQLVLDLNQSIVKIKDKDLLLEKVCEQLTTDAIFNSVWIGLCDEKDKFYKVVANGFERNFLIFKEKLLAGKIPSCVLDMNQKKLLYVYNPIKKCKECELKSLYPKDSAIVLRLQYQGKTYGYLGCSLLTIFLDEKEVNRLLIEVSENIAFSLYNLDLELEQKESEQKLYKINNELMQYKENLEELVENRTLELNKSLEELKMAQAHLIETEKMAALGGLVAGVAHEINTPIGLGITSVSYFVQETNKLQKSYENQKMSKRQLEEYLHDMLELSNVTFENLKRAARLVKSFKQVSVDQSHEEKREFLLKKYTEEILLSFFNDIKKTNIQIKINCIDNLSMVTYPGAFSQIITNLIINSFMHAYEENDEGTIELDFKLEGSTLDFIYRDDGKGISQEHIKQIFDPFFTTKRGQGGSGLGLNIIYNLITQKLKGTISCESEEGKGVQFIIKIPLLSF